MIVNHKSIVIVLLSFLAVIMHGSVYWAMYAQNSYMYLGAIFIICLLLAQLYFGGIHRWYFAYVISMGLCYILSALFNGIGFSSGLNIQTVLVYAINILVIAVGIDIDLAKFTRMYVRVIVIFAFISLIFYFLTSILGKNTISSMFQFYTWGRGHYVNLFYTMTVDGNRNYGIFYEPGVYQIVLLSALYLLIYAKEIFALEKWYTFSIVTLVITLLTTGSTTGYLGILFIILGLLFQYRKGTIERRITFLFFIFTLYVFIDYVIHDEASFINTYVINKFYEMEDNGYMSSGGSRLFMFDLAVHAVKESPFFGLGELYLRNAISELYFNDFGTGNALCAMIASKGLITTVVVIGPLLVMAYRRRRSFLQYIVFLAIYVNTVIAQSANSIICCSFFLIAYIDFKRLEQGEIGIED